jgi:predicted secreted hydrolase
MKRAAAVLGLVVAAAAWAVAQEAWQKASPARVVSVPRDHVSHPGYKIEWWYYTGNVETDRGRRFGYQVTFFRVGINLNPSKDSKWSVRDLFVTHIAVTDAEGHRHLFAERVNRAGVGWAGASNLDYHVWNEDWEVRPDYGRHRLTARDPRFAIDLVLNEDKPAVLNGEAGFSQKGASPGNATHYYSLTRMPTEGAISIDGTRYDVRGDSWMDHEFGTSFLEAGQQGWDWFSLQLADGTDLMMFRMRRSDGSVDPHSSGTLVARGGTPRRLLSSDFELEPGRTWTSPATRAAYPVEWHVTVPAEEIDMRVRPVVDAQELVGTRSGVSYWEGAIDVAGTRRGQPLTGRGYLEMTGYAGPAMGDLLR